MVFSNVGSSSEAVTAAISAFMSDMPCSKAGRKCSTRIKSKGGTP